MKYMAKFASCKVEKINRVSNSWAHNTARWAASNSWVGCFPYTYIPLLERWLVNGLDPPLSLLQRHPRSQSSKKLNGKARMTTYLYRYWGVWPRSRALQLYRLVKGTYFESKLSNPTSYFKLKAQNEERCLELTAQIKISQHQSYSLPCHGPNLWAVEFRHTF